MPEGSYVCVVCVNDCVCIQKKKKKNHNQMPETKNDTHKVESYRAAGQTVEERNTREAVRFGNAFRPHRCLRQTQRQGVQHRSKRQSSSVQLNRRHVS